MSSSTPTKSFDILQSPTSPNNLRSPSAPGFPRYPFPRQDSSQRTQLSNRYNARRGSTASVASSIGGTLDTATSKTEQINELAHNAISTLLSPPIVRTGLVPHTSLPASSIHRAPTARDIPPVNLASIPKVDSTVFKTYLSQVGTLFDQFQRAKQSADEEAHASRDNPFEKDDGFPDLVPRHGSFSSRSSSRRSSIVAAPKSPLIPPSPGSARPRRDRHAPTPLSTIPSVYLDQNFQLENPRTFDVVSEHADIIPQERPGSRDANKGDIKPPAPSGRKALHLNAMLQEKLSWYMDTVEVHLITSISTASSSFFAALGSLKELQAEAQDSVDKIKGLRSALQNLDTGMAVGGLEIVNMQRRRQNLRRLGAAVSQLCEVTERAKECESLVDEQAYDKAVIAIDDLEHLISGKTSDVTPERIDLRNLKALDGIGIGLANLQLRIGKGFETRFIEALVSDLREHVESVLSKETLQRWSNASIRSRGGQTRNRAEPPAYLKTNNDLRPTLVAALAGLTKAGHTAHAATAYREAVMREIKTLIRKHLPSSNDDDAESMTSVSTRGGRHLNQQEKSSILARNLRILDSDSAEDLLVKVYAGVGEALRRLSMQVKVLLDVTSTIEAPRSSIDEQQMISPSKRQNQIRDEVTQALDLSSLLGQAVDVIQHQITKVLKVRTEQTTHLPLDSFVRYFTLNRLFADECEAVSGRSGDALKEVINSQIKGFVNVLIETQKERIGQALDEDRWEAKDFGTEESKILERILESMTRTPKAWTSFGAPWEDSDDKPITNGSSQPLDGDAPKTIRTATIDEHSYILVNSVHVTLHSLETFLSLAASVPSLANDAALRLLDLLKHFNSRAVQLVLGTGATRSAAGLKNITTKHLALVSQACSFLVALVPYMREYFRRQLNNAPAASGLLAEFDKVKRLLQDHQTSVHEKLTEIMTSRSAGHVIALQKINWDVPSDATSPPVESLIKETSTVHRVLSRHVSESDLRMVLVPVFVQYAEQWSAALRGISIKTEAGKQRLLADMQALEARLGKLDVDGARELGAKLVALVVDKDMAGTKHAKSSSVTSIPPEKSKVAATAEVQKPVNVAAEPTNMQATEKSKELDPESTHLESVGEESAPIQQIEDVKGRTSAEIIGGKG